MSIVKILDMQEQVTVMMKIKFIRNRATLNIPNNTHKTVTFDPTEMIGILVIMRSSKTWCNRTGVSITTLNQPILCATNLTDF